MIRLSDDVERQGQVADLLRHYTWLGRPQAGRNLIAAIDQAMSFYRCHVDRHSQIPKFPLLHLVPSIEVYDLLL